jgi:hypothetical protein
VVEVQHEPLKEGNMLPEEIIIIGIYCAIGDGLSAADRRHEQGRLWLSELVLCGVLWALKGGSFLGFYRWLARRKLFADLPERSRLLRLLKEHRAASDMFLAEASFFNVMDTFGIEIIHPVREGRSAQSLAVCGKGKSNHRWIVGRKICVRINDTGRVVAYDDDTVNVCDKIFNALADDDTSITLADFNFRDKNGIPPTMKICPRGSWNERMTVEDVFSLWTLVCHAKRFFVRSVEAFKTRIAYLVALTNIAFDLNQAWGFPLNTLAHFSL